MRVSPLTIIFSLVPEISPQCFPYLGCPPYGKSIPVLPWSNRTHGRSGRQHPCQGVTACNTQHLRQALLYDRVLILCQLNSCWYSLLGTTFFEGEQSRTVSSGQEALIPALVADTLAVSMQASVPHSIVLVLTFIS